MGQAESKEEGAVVGGAVSSATISTGVGLMFLGPIGMAVGGIMMGAGISSAVNTIDQCKNNKEDTFDYGAWGKNVGIGAAGGAIAAPFSAVGGLAASGLASTSAKVATVVAAETIGGAVSGGSTNLISKASDGKEVSGSDFFKGALVGAAAGVVGGLAGQGAQKGASALTKGAGKTIGSQMSKAAQAIRVGCGAAGGAAGGAGGAAIGKIIENALYHGELKRGDFMKLMKERYKVDDDDAMALWAFLCNNGIIVDEKVEKKIPSYLQFPEDLQEYEEEIHQLIDSIHEASVTEGAGSAAVQGAVTGGVMGGISAAAEIRQQKRIIRKQGEARAKQVRQPGELAGSIEAEAYARSSKKKVVVHQDNGTSKIYGSHSAKDEVHVHYSSDELHYHPADAHGEKIPIKNGTPGDCLFEALSHHTGEKPADVRQKVSSYIEEKPHQLNNIGLEELAHGGSSLGGGNRDWGRKIKITENDEKKALAYFEDKCPDLKRRAQEALNDLKNLNVKRLRQMEFNTGPRGSAKKGYHFIHTLGRELEGHVSVDVIPYEMSATRSSIRMVFKLTRSNKLEYVNTTLCHNYKNILN